MLLKEEEAFQMNRNAGLPSRGHMSCLTSQTWVSSFTYIKTWGFKKLTLHLSPFVLCCTVSVNILSVTLMFKFSCVLYNHENFYLPRPLRKIRYFLFSLSNQYICFSWKLDRRQLFLDFSCLPVSGAVRLKFSLLAVGYFRVQGVVVRGH